MYFKLEFAKQDCFTDYEYCEYYIYMTMTWENRRIGLTTERAVTMRYNRLLAGTHVLQILRTRNDTVGRVEYLTVSPYLRYCCTLQIDEF